MNEREELMKAVRELAASEGPINRAEVVMAREMLFTALNRCEPGSEDHNTALTAIDILDRLLGNTNRIH